MARPGEKWRSILEVQRRFGRSLERSGALWRAEASSGVEERTGGGKPRMARRGAEELAGDLAKLGGRSGVTGELQSSGTTSAELRRLTKEDHHSAELKN